MVNDLFFILFEFICINCESTSVKNKLFTRKIYFSVECRVCLELRVLGINETQFAYSFIFFWWSVSTQFTAVIFIAVVN